MFTRRAFAEVASCALCALTAGFSAEEVFAQGGAAQPAPTPGVTRKLLSRTDGLVPGYETLIMDVTVEAGETAARHKHPGIESTFVMEGTVDLPIEGQATRSYKVGEAWQIPPNTPHAGGPASKEKVRLLINYIVEKGKPLASPV